MKMNFDYYKGEDLYCDGSTEDEVIEYLRKYPKEKITDVFEQDMRWPIFYHLTEIRHNILKWYPFKKDAHILEVGAGMGAITEILCEKAAKVTAVELSKKRATAIEVRANKYDNLEVIVGNLNDVKFEEKFDYITLIGVYEYAQLYTNTDNPFVDFLKYLKQFLKDDGKILIAIENKFGMKYFAGAPEDHTTERYDSITGYRNKNGVKTFGKQEIIEILKQAGINNTKFYYPFPDYKLPNCIFSDNYLPDEETLDLYYKYYYENSIISFDEKKAYKEILKENVFDFFANSFFIEAGNTELSTEVDFALFDIFNSNGKEFIGNKDNIKKTDFIEEYKALCEKGNPNIKEFFTRKYISEEENIKEVEHLKEQIKRLENENLELRKQLEGVYDSKSWKFTKIFRKK